MPATNGAPPTEPNPARDSVGEEPALDLPALDIDDGSPEQADDGPLDLALPEDDDDPFDDSVATDIPIDESFAETAAQPSVLGDDETGIEHMSAAVGLSITEETAHSLIDDNTTEMGVSGERDDLGLGAMTEAGEDTDLDGVDDPGQRLDHDQLPPLDAAEPDDDDEVDVGIILPVEREPAETS